MSNPTNSAIQAAAIPDAREARLLALHSEWGDILESNAGEDSVCSCERCYTLRQCARELLTALRGDA